ncbi:MAG: protein phosphatase 2C domain-containing protein [Polyangiales bacterium]
MKIECGAATDMGRDRDENEDAFWIDEARGMCAVIDGIAGARSSGTFAAQLALTTLRAHAERHAPRATTALDDEARSLLRSVNDAILREQGRSPYGRGFGCSAVLIVLGDDEVALASSGVCVALRVRDDGQYEELSEAQDLRREYHRFARPFDFDADRVAPRKVIAGMLGIQAAPRIESTLELVRPGDLFVVCTDPVLDSVTPSEIASIVREHERVQSMADAIVARSVARSGAMNATALVARAAG